MSMTADGKIATANRAIESFGSPHDQHHLLEVRATADAVICGSRTVSGTNYDLGPGGPLFQRRRLRRSLAESNLRILVSGQARLDPSTALFQNTSSPTLVLVTHSAPKRRVRALRAVATQVAAFGDQQLDLPAALHWIHQQWGVRRLVCEGGATLNDALFQARLVDELHLTTCPFIFGGRLAPTLAEGFGAPSLSQATRLRLLRLRRVQNEVFLVYQVLPLPTPNG
jgi:riboflavin-specific deaminase-like protein